MGNKIFFVLWLVVVVSYSPAQSAPAQSAPAQSAPAQSAPAQSAPAQSAPAQSAPAQSAPAAMDAPPVLQQVWWLLASIGGFAVAVLAGMNLYITIKHKRMDNMWERVQKAESLVDAIYKSPYAHAALRMTDGSLTMLELLPEYATAGEATIVSIVPFADAAGALITPMDKDIDVPKARTICHCYDTLFYHFDRIETYLERGLVDFHDIDKPLRYYAVAFGKQENLFRFYIDLINYTGSVLFLRRFGVWSQKGGDCG